MTEMRDRRPHGATVLDLDAILAPLAEGDGCGADLHDAADSPFHDIDEARRSDDDLPQGVWVHDRKQADWDQVVALCQKVLARRSKDLRVAARLAEALVNRDGFAGLGPALSMIEALCRRFWPGLHPRVDEDGDLSGRANAIALLNARLPRVLRTLPITRSGQNEAVSYSWGDYETARLLESRGAAKKGGLTLAAFEASAFASPVPLLERLRANLTGGLAALERLDGLLDDACRREAPSLEALRGLLGEMTAWLGTVIPASQPPEPVSDPADDGELNMTEANSSPVAAVADGPIASREDAYRRLSEIADYLMRTEPHSPTPYVLRRVHAWGRMPLHQLLIDMAQGRNDLATIMELITPKESEMQH
ncbi:MAG: type VI secretion system protein TssA [Magnetospirillum sp.]|nr:type VI secretion system protein TssA [Magnetospirillum sp.]